MTTTTPDIAHLDHDLDPTCDDCDAPATWTAHCCDDGLWINCTQCRHELVTEGWSCGTCVTWHANMNWRPL